jgi:hypothetical protein
MRIGKILLLCLCFSAIWGAAVSPPVLAQQRTLGPVLRIYTDPFLFDTVRCRIRRCIPLTFHNIGDTALVVRNHDVLRRPFFVRIDTPLVLQPGEMRTFDLCYNPSQYSTDSQKVFIRADTRLPLSIAMVHDVSASMFTDMPGGKKRYQAAHDASVEFIGNLLDTLGVQDEGAVFTYDDNEHFKVTQTWTRDTAALRAAIPNVVLGTATCTYDAISRVIDSMETRVKKRILIMVTDGEDSGAKTCGPATPESVINKAVDHDVRIYAITIGNIDRAPLIRIAKESGGKEFNASVSTDLLAIYREIAVDMSKNVQVSIFMKGAAAGPKVEMTPPDISFDSVQVGQTACMPVLVRNAGNAWLHADTVRKIFQPPYSLQDLAVDSIAPYQTVPANVCFTPLLPLHYQIPMPYFPSPCEFVADTLMGSGNSFLLPRAPRKRPLLEVRVPAFDTTFCQTTECATLELRNAGDTAVTVHSLDFIPPPFTGSEAVPFTVAPGETKTITICYRPPDAPRLDTLRLGLTADMRTPQRIALFFDEGRSMKTEFMPGLSRLLAASAGASDFADGLEFRAGFTDALTIARFDSAGVLRWDGNYFTAKDSLRAALPDSAGDQVSCAYDAVDRLLTGFDGLHREPETVILFTAGEDAGASLCGPVTAMDLASHALTMGVRIHCVQLGDADSAALALLAQSTGGRFLRPQSLLDLILGLRDLESEFSRNVRFEHQAVARGVTPVLSVDVDSLDFGTLVRSNGGINAVSKRPMRLMNIGDAPMHLMIDSSASPFLMQRGVKGSPIVISGPPDFTNMRPASGDTVISPGDTLYVVVAFVPKEAGEFTDSITFSHDGCIQPSAMVYLRGRHLLGFEDPWRYPSAADAQDVLRFDTLSCGGEQCRHLVFSNADSIASTLRFPRPISAPFHALLPDSLIVPAGGDSSIEVCYRPRSAGVHETWLHFESDAKPALSTIFLIASDLSTLDTLEEGLPFRVLTRQARITYADWIHGGPGAVDETAVLAFDDAGQEEVLRFTSERTSIEYAQPDSSLAAAGMLATAVTTAIDYAAANARGRKIVIAIVNDANPIDVADAAALRERAVREDVTLAIAAVGEDGYTVLAPTAGQAARFDSCFTLDALERFIYETTRSAVVTVRDSVYLAGTATEAKLEIEPLTLDFGTIRVGGDACLPVTLRNSGNAPVTIVNVVNPVEPFPTAFPDTLQAGQSAEVELCFAASALGARSVDALFIYDGCARDTIRVHMTASGFDSVNVGISATLRGMPGHVIRIPVQLYGAIPESYGVRGYTLSLSYDKTMLYPLTEGIVSPGTVTAVVQAPEPVLERIFSDLSPTATARYQFNSTEALASDGSSAVLLAPPFLVLHGSAMETPLRVTGIRFREGSPAVGIVVESRFIADSLCFQQERLVDASARYNAALVGGYPNPFNPVATIAYSLREAAMVRLCVHDALGREIRILDDGMRESGVHRARFDADGLPTGVYFYRLETAGELHSGSLLYLK